VIAVTEIRRLLRRADEHRRSGGAPLLARHALVKLGVYAGYGVQRFRDPGRFTFAGDTYECIVHPYNATWRNERAAELPLARSFLNRMPGRGLEVGNVLAHYGPIDHVVVDRYERADGVVNVDASEYTAEEPFDFIVSISTLEHVGWDEGEVRQPDKARQTVEHLRTLLAPSGVLFLTCPAGYNPGLDRLMFEPSTDHPPLRHGFLRRDRSGGRFHQIDAATAQAHVTSGSRDIVVWIAEFGPPR
jgi:SAM-dependent methyltransferase